MLTKKKSDVNAFDIDPVDDLMDSISGVIGCLEGEKVACVSSEPETIIVIRTNQVDAASGNRLFASRVYVGEPLTKVIEDLQKQQQ